MKNGKCKTHKQILAAMFVSFIAGCSSSAPTTQPESISQRQDRALADPMNYQVPATPGPSSDNGNHNLKSDLNDVINP
jgi:uncharacterized lipoprotein